MLGSRNPIFIHNPSSVPDLVTSEDDKLMTKVYCIITYDLMNQCNITMNHLFKMGCNFQIILHSWGLRPCATNLKFVDSTKETIMALYNSLQNSLICSLFKINWFDIGMTIQNLIAMQLPVIILKMFNVTCDTLIKHNAHEYSETWQSLFNWTQAEWKLLGYDAAEYKKKIISDIEIPQSKKDLYLLWGPKTSTSFFKKEQK